MLSCGTCASGQSCVANACVANSVDAGHPSDAGSGNDAGGASDAGRDASAHGGDAAANADGGSVTPGNPGGCGCRTAASEDAPPWAAFGAAGLALAGAVRIQRRRKSR
jgi:MYXO-CTERM domain-containing protein